MGIQVDVTSDASKATKDLILLEAALNRIRSMSFNINIKPLMSASDMRAAESAVNKIKDSTKTANDAFQSLSRSNVGASLEQVSNKFGRINQHSANLKNNQIALNKAMLDTAASSARIESTLSKAQASFNKMVTGAAAFVAVGATATGITNMLDKVTNMRTQMSLAIDDQADLQGALNQTKRIAIDTRSNVSDITELYSKISRATSAFNRTQQDVATVTSTVAKAISMSGASAASSSAAVIQLGQALGSGVLQGDELRSILENAPGLARAISEGLGVSIGELRKLGAAGELTAKMVFDALKEQADLVDARFKTAGVTYAQAFTVIGAAVSNIGREMQAAFFDPTTKTIPAYLKDVGEAIFNFSERIGFQVLKLKTEAYFMFKDIRSFFALPFDFKIKTVKLAVLDLLPNMLSIKAYAKEMLSTIKSVFANAVSITAGLTSGTSPGRHAAGGLITGAGSGVSDDIPAMLSNGEFVVNAKATKKNLSVLQAINNDQAVAKFSGGGLVGDLRGIIESGISKIRMLPELSIAKLDSVFKSFVDKLKSLIPTLDTVLSKVRGAIGLEDSTISKLKASTIVALGAATAGLVLLVSKGNSTIRNFGLGLTAFFTERAVSSVTDTSAAGSAGPYILDKLLKVARTFTDLSFGKPKGINTLTEGGTLTRSVFIDGLFGDRGFSGVISSIARLALLFGAGRALIGGGLLKTLTAPTLFAQNMAVAYQANSAEKAYQRSNAVLLRDTKQIEDLRQIRKDAISDLSKINGIGKRGAETIASGGAFATTGPVTAQMNAAATAARNAAMALEKHEAATKDSLRTTTENTSRLKSMSEALRGQVDATKAAAKQGVVNFGAGLGGTFGALIGFNIGGNIAAGMANSTALERTMVTVAATMGVQMAGSLVGTGLALTATWLAGAGASLIGGLFTKLTAGIAAAMLSPILSGTILIGAALTAALVAWQMWPWFAEELKEWKKLGARWVAALDDWAGKKLPRSFRDPIDAQNAYNDANDAAARALPGDNFGAKREAADLNVIAKALTAKSEFNKFTDSGLNIPEGRVAAARDNLKVYSDTSDPVYIEASQKLEAAIRENTEKTKPLIDKDKSDWTKVEKAFSSFGEMLSKIVAPENFMPYDVVKKATGGRISGPGSGTSDSIPAMLSNGEFVINAKASAENADLLHAINTGKTVRRFAGGNTAPSGSPDDTFERLVKAIRGLENATNDAAAVSHKGAVGLMQMIPSTFNAFKQNANDVITDPKANVAAGRRYLEHLWKKFDGDVEKVAAGYHAGEGVIRKDGSINPASNDFKDKEKQTGGMFTTAYAAKIAAAVYGFKDKFTGNSGTDRGTLMRNSGMYRDTFSKEKTAAIGTGEIRKIFEKLPLDMQKMMLGWYTSVMGKRGGDQVDPLSRSVTEIANTINAKLGGVGGINESQLLSLSNSQLSELRNTLSAIDRLTALQSDPSIRGLQAVEIGKAMEEAVGSLRSIFETKTSAKKAGVFDNIDFNNSEGLDAFNSAIASLGITLNATSFEALTSTQINDLEYALTRINDLNEEVAARGPKASVAAKLLSEQLTYVKGMLKNMAEVKALPVADPAKVAPAKVVEGYVEGIHRSFTDGVSAMLKGDASFEEFGAMLVDKFTNSVIDSVVQGFSDDLFSNVLSPYLNKMFSSLNLTGSDIASGKDGKGGINAPISSALSWLFPSDEEKLQSAKTAFMRSEHATQLDPAAGGSLLTSPFEDTVANFTQSFDDTFGTNIAKFGDTFNSSGDLFEGIFGSFGEDFSGILGSFGSGIMNMFSGGGGGGSGALGLLSGLGSLGSSSTDFTSLLTAFGGFAEGGPVYGAGTATSDSIPAFLSNGEFVVNAAATREYAGLLARINSGKTPKFANGGPVSMLGNINSVSSLGGTNNTSKAVFNINVTGDISMQTRKEIQQMIPQIATGINTHNYEQGSRR